MRIAIIGSGISGLVCAHLLHPDHDITVFEANGYVGGHAHTVTIDVDDESHPVDTGFIVFNARNYPNFCRLLDRIGARSQPTSMSFSVHCQRTGLEYNGSSLDGLFAQRCNLLRPSFYQMLRDILRFNREAPRLLHELSDEDTLADFLDERGYSRGFADHYLLPMGAAIWSCPPSTFAQFPVRFIIEFYTNHGLLQVRDRPVWRTIEGGSQQYVERLIAPFRSSIRLHHPVRSVFRSPEGVLVKSSGAQAELFDEVIFACHSDQALRILDDADPHERSVLSALPYGGNTAVLHTDVSVLPRRRRAWASWNYRLNRDPAHRPAVTYNMNMLQHIRSRHTFCLTLNGDDAIDPATVLGTFQYSHPVFTTRRTWAQHQHREFIRRRRTSFCGAYWGNGFHEAGVNSAMAVCRGFGVDFDGEARPTQNAQRGVLA